MERVGKRSVTPLWVSIHPGRQIESAVAAGSSAGALQMRALMECGGKRSATPLCVSIHPGRRIESAVAAGSSAGVQDKNLHLSSQSEGVVASGVLV